MYFSACQYELPFTEKTSTLHVGNDLPDDFLIYGELFFFQEALKSLTGRSTVPNVFIKGTSIGGGSETAELYQSGRLTEMLQEQGIIK